MLYDPVAQSLLSPGTMLMYEDVAIPAVRPLGLNQISCFTKITRRSAMHSDR